MRHKTIRVIDYLFLVIWHGPERSNLLRENPPATRAGGGFCHRQTQPPSRGRRRFRVTGACRRAGPGSSGEGVEHFLVRRESAGRLLGVGEPAVHHDLEDAAAGTTQIDLRGGLGLQDRVPRLTGARFVASLPTVLNFDPH